MSAQKEFREVQSLGTILQFLSPEIPASLQQSSARVIGSICKNNGKNSQLVINEYGLHSLVELLQSEDAAVLHQVLLAICNIIEEDRKFFKY